MIPDVTDGGVLEIAPDLDFVHGHDDPETPVRHQPLKARPIVIGAGARVGHRAVVEAGTVVEAGATVAVTTLTRPRLQEHEQ